MKRRDFLKYLGVGTAGVGLGFMFGRVQKPPGAKLIPYLIPPEDIIPGVASWYATLCTECGAGCGALVKIMEGRAKKIEGNPKHPVNKGGLCARGHSALQTLYNPDRIKGPLKRRGGRGSADFVEISWDEALDMLGKKFGELKKAGAADKLWLLTAPMSGHKLKLISAFMSAYGSPHIAPYELFQHRNLAYANQTTMGVKETPHYDIANTNYLLSFGADFSSTWLSPVNFSRGYGEMRQGSDRKTRGRLVQIEPRLSLTGGNADEWIPVRPGGEALLALSIAHTIIKRGYYKGGDAGTWRSLLSVYAPSETALLIDVPAEKIEELAAAFMEGKPGLAIAGDGALSYADGVSCAVAVNILNHLAGSIGVKGGVVVNSSSLLGKETIDFKKGVGALLKAANSSEVSALIVHNANPLYATPNAANAKESLNKIPFIVSFSGFIDETTAMADLVLPAHHSLEDWGDGFASPSVGYPVSTVMQPVVSPVNNTRGVGDIFLALASKIGFGMKERLKSDSFEDYLKSGWKELYNKNKELSAGTLGFPDFWLKMLATGGWWKETAPAKKTAVSPNTAARLLPARPSAFEGNDKEYPFYLVLYPHHGLGDGRHANLPWMQELPDPMTSMTWGSWLEINPKTAEALGIKQGDFIEVESPFGKITLQAYLYPGIRPDAVAVPIGQGHTHLGRYAKDRGVNPIDILPYKEDSRTGSVALNSTRVKLVRTGANEKLAKTEGVTKELGRNIVQTISSEEFEKFGKEII
ncbi:MAG: molybdopterin-dependent oxidoreductase [Thermodesulfobacteriota bacterium]